MYLNLNNSGLDFKANIEFVSNGCGYNFSKMYPYPKSSRWNEQLECGESGRYVAPPSRPHFYRSN